MIFSTPQATSGAANQPAANKAPPSVGLSAAARLRGTAVKLAAAALSPGVTTAMTKAARAGMRVLVAVSAPTTLAVSLAEQSNLSLVAFARPGKFSVYTVPARIDT